jgi:4-aminobutyrate aminotransferase-like enzyme/Ser/Thr protein kinase RdoA (MazF antagonist)
MKADSSTPTIDQVSALCASQYDLTGQISHLPGENDNFLIESTDGEKYALKLAGEDRSIALLELEHMAIEHLLNSGIDLQLARTIPTIHGDIIANYQTEAGRQLHARLLEFVPGTPWCQAAIPDSEQLNHLGRTLATLDLALAEIDLPEARRTHAWDLTKTDQHRSKVTLVDDPQRRRFLEWMLHFYTACALPGLSNLPHSLIHNDVNDENTLVQDGKVVGLLDFTDCIYNPTVCDLAIALAYAMLDQPDDPLDAGAQIVAGYHTVRPLSEDELAVLYPLVCGRLCTTASMAAKRRRIDPDHPTWYVTEERAWRLLEQLYPVDPVEAGNHLASGTGLDPFDDFGTPLEKLLEKRKRHIGPSLSIAYQEPLKMVRGRGQYLYDHRGRPFLDLVNNVCHVGHCHPRIVEAGQRQMAQLNTNTRYIYDGLTDYAERLCETLPDSLDTCFFVNSGSEANELALRMTMTHTGRRHLLVLDGGYHGNTPNLTAISPYKFMGKGGSGAPEPWVHVVPMPDGYRGIYKGQDRSTGVAYSDEVGRVIAEADVPIAAFITESILSCGGQIIPPEGYLETAFQHVREAGGLCIVDEVQVGIGRVGTHFWAFELQNVIPDIVVLGKPIGNGHPMAAVVTTRQIAESFANGMEFFSTFGGNPVSCSIGMAVLDVIRDEGLQAHALDMGTRLREGLRALMAEHSLIGDVRGAGLFIGVELVRDRITLEPAPEEADELVERMKRRGMLLSTDGPLHNVIKIKPPMVLTADDVDMLVRGLDDELYGMKGS